mmetsp:Transcript_15702/g.43928  ORF Transcript_15702/g.43928 Transcript_15702/m.43928 type:complete len:233 (+) Transcript_15702:166-864(+)
MGNLKSKYSSKSSSSSQKKGEITEADRAILNLKTQRRKLNDQRSRLEKLTEREREIVKELLAKKLKQRAILTLKKVKQQEGQIDQIDTYLMRVEEMLVNMETTKETKRLFDTLRMGADALKAAQSELSIEEVEQLAEDTAEAKEYEQHLAQLMGESWTGELDAEVMEELESLERVVFGEELPELPEKQLAPTEAVEEALPEVPDHTPEPADLLRAQAKAAGGKVKAEPLPAE